MTVRQRIGRALRGSSRRGDLRVRDATRGQALAVAAADTIRSATERMTAADASAALVKAPDSASPGIFTARDALAFVAAGHDADSERVADHATANAVSIGPDADLDEAARTMSDRRFRHLVVDGPDGTTIVSMRDVVSVWIREHATPDEPIQIRRSMNTSFLAVGLDETVSQAAKSMAEHGAVAAVVNAEERPYPGIVTEREVVHTLGAGGDPERERVADHLASGMSFSAPDWSLKQAAEAMTKGNFQHVLVVDRHEIRGVISMLDVVTTWVEERTAES